jgi:hypothetical protein
LGSIVYGLSIIGLLWLHLSLSLLCGAIAVVGKLKKLQLEPTFGYPLLSLSMVAEASGESTAALPQTTPHNLRADVKGVHRCECCASLGDCCCVARAAVWLCTATALGSLLDSDSRKQLSAGVRAVVIAGTAVVLASA